MSLTAFFLCAGYGKRLRPLTDRIPKPCIPFLGQSALEINVRAVEAALKPERRIANTHHLPDAVRAVAKPLGLDVIFEPEILGTGGCIAHAAPVLRDTEHFLVHNADLIHSIDLAALYHAHLDSNAMATLVALNVEGGANTVSVSQEGELLGVHGFDGFSGDSHESKRLTFAGIAFYRRDVLAFIPDGVSDIKPWWMATLKGGGKIRVVDVSGAPWYDFGTPQGLWDAMKYRMEATGIYARGYDAAPDDQGRPPRVSNETGMTGLPPGLRNVVVYESPRIPLEEGTTNLLTGFDFDWKVRP
jgi:mannose-1-phosphate guanylyltransferase